MNPQQNRLLTSLDIQPSSNKIISIKECGNVDSNFIITHLINQILQDKGNICMVILHNSLAHYEHVGKKLGYDFSKSIQEGNVRTVEPLKDIVDDLDEPTNYLILNKEHIVKNLFKNIQDSVKNLAASSDNRIYLIIDDLSHLLDLGVDISLVVNFTNYCLSLIETYHEGKMSVIINTHVCSKADEIICCNINYVADVIVDILPLKTGQSMAVTGLIRVEKSRKISKFHYKAFDRGVKTFHLGESIYNLYK